MAETIDSLQLEISADSAIAEKSLNRLASALIKVQSSVNGISTGQFSNLANGIRRLSDAMERMNGAVKTADFTRIATGLNKLTSVNVLGVSDASRAISTLTANLSSLGTISFDAQGIANIANAIAQLGRKTVTQATQNIPALSTALTQLVSGMNGIKAVSFDTKGLLELTTAISRLGGKSATAAASGNIEKLAVALKNMMTTLSTAPQVSRNIIDMAQALGQLAASGNRVGSATSSLTNSFKTFDISTKKSSKSAGGLAAAFGKFYATYWLILRSIGVFRKAIDISSDLTEVQNVVDVTFGDMAEKMNEFADSALSNYGMSELMAKTIASRFQAMGVAMGFAQGQMSDMSIELTKLAGDMASFYNVTQQEIATSLQSIFTGETEPLRRFGLDLSFATIEAWALANGLNADMQSMTQAEKTMLRYQYVLANTGAAQGDFLRTVNSWHNQLVLLTGAFQQLGNIVGGVLVNAFKPFIQALNSVMGAVINFAQVVSDALGAIFGWEYQVGGGAAQEYEAAAGAASDLEDATGRAAKKAKELNRYIAAWHEVNNMTTSDSGSGGGSGGGGGAGGAGGAADGGEWIQKESLWEKYTSSIDTLYELGDYIGGVLTDAMNDIDWDSVYQGARNFGTGLASFLNGLISVDLFGALGRTIAGALNTAIYAALSFGQTFDWTNLGESIAAGINNFFGTFDAASYAETFNTYVLGLLDALIAAIDNTDWNLIGTQIGTYLEHIDFLTIAGKLAQALWKAIGAAIKTWGSSFSAAPVETVLVTAVAALKFTSLGKIIAAKIAASIAKGLGSSAVITTISAGFKALTGSKAAQSALVFMFPKTAAVVSAVGGFISGSVIPAITSGIASIGTAATGAITALAGALGISVTAAGALVLGAVAAAVAGIVAVVLNWDSIKNFFTNTIPSFFSGTVVPFFQSLPDKIGNVWDTLTTYTSQKWEELMSFMAGIPDRIGSIIDSIVEWFSDLPYEIGYELGETLGEITRWAVDTYDYLKEEIPKTVSAVVTWFGELPDKAYAAISVFFSRIQAWASETYNSFKTAVSNAVTAVQTWFGELPDKAYNEIIKIKEKIQQWGTQAISFFQVEVPKIVDKVVEFFGDLPKRIVAIGEDLIRGLWQGISNMIDWLGTNISGFINGIIDGFREGFDEHSPSKIAFEIGDYFTLGLGNGIVSRFDDIYKDIQNFTDNVSSTRITMPKVNILPDTSNLQFKPTKINAAEITGKVQEALEYAISAGGLIDYNRLGQAVYEAQSQVAKENPLKIGDRDVFDANTRETIKFGKRTGKMPYPVY